MGKKDKKKKDPSAKEQKKQKQAAKANKKAAKGGGEKELAEEDIEAILAEFRQKEAQKTVVTVTECPQPSPRANFTLTTLPNNELLLYGGEYYDGEDTVVYNGVYRWNLEKNEWRQIESPNTPAPRCSHQAVCYREHLYIFGGEFSTSDTFYHYRDFWRLDLKTNKWEELPLQRETPSARSGHRVVVWRNFLILFGGFYEAFREVKWFNDLYLFNFQDLKWRKVEIPSHALMPSPRSGCQIAVSLSNDVVYIHGGYSRVKQQTEGGKGGAKAEGFVHQDMWALNLKNVPSGGQPFWERVTRKGHPPSARSGASMVAYKTIALTFGGVYDVEGKQHSMKSVFYADLHQLDMVRRRWFTVRLRDKTDGTDGKAKRRRGKAKENNTDELDDGSDAEADGDDDGRSAAKEEEEGFAYIDADGNIVYIHHDELGEEEEEEGQQATEALAQGVSGVSLTENGAASDAGEGKADKPSRSRSAKPPGDDADDQEHENEVKGPEEGLLSGNGSADVTTPRAVEPQVPLQRETRVIEGQGMVLVEDGRVGPLPRINPALTIRGHHLYVYGGVYEEGDREFTLDDCWCFDLNRRVAWECVLPGTMHLQAWKGEEESDMGDEDDEESDDSESESDGDGGESGDEMAAGVTPEEAQRGDDDQEERKDDDLEGSKSTSDRHKRKGSRGLRGEIAELQEQLAVDDPNRTPQLGEGLKEFFSRTRDYWTQVAVDEFEKRVTQAQADGASNAMDTGLREKEYRRMAFEMAQQRFEELKPVLERLNELEQEQREHEERHARKKEAERKGGKSRAKDRR